MVWGGFEEAGGGSAQSVPQESGHSAAGGKGDSPHQKTTSTKKTSGSHQAEPQDPLNLKERGTKNGGPAGK